MQFWQQLMSRLRPQPASDPFNAQLAALIAEARRAANAEDYDRAWEKLQEAAAAAQQAGDLLRFDIVLQQAYVRLGHQAYDEAQALIAQAHLLAQAQVGRAPLAYVQIAEGQLAEVRGDLAAAEAAYERARATARAVQASAPQGRATALLGALALREGNAAFAAHLLREAIPLMEAARDDELLAFAYGQLGLALIASGDPARGLGLLNKAIEIGMKHNQVVTLRALNRAAAEQFTRVGMYDKAYANYLNLLKLYPYPERTPLEFLEVHIRAAYLAYHSSNIDDGLALVAKAHALQAALSDHTLFPTLQAVEGLLLLQTDQTTRAISLLETVQQSAEVPEAIQHEARQALAEAYHRALRFEEALALLQSSLKEAQAHGDYVTLAGIAYIRRFMPNQRPAAIADYQAMAQLAEQRGAPDMQAIALAHLSVVEAELGIGPRVLRRLERALLLSNHSNTAAGPVLHAAATVHYDYGDLETAEGLARKALDHADDPESAAIVQLTLARILLARGQPEAALSALHLVEASSSQINKLGALARVCVVTSAAYCALGNPALALQYAQQGLQTLQQPERQPEAAASVYRALGLAQIAAGEAAAGRRSLREALAYAQRSDNQLQIWEITLQLADALLPHEADEAAALLASPRDALHKAEPRRLLVMLHTVESKLAAYKDDMAAARQHWQLANYHRQLAQLPSSTATWLERSHE